MWDCVGKSAQARFYLRAERVLSLGGASGVLRVCVMALSQSAPPGVTVTLRGQREHIGHLGVPEPRADRSHISATEEPRQWAALVNGRPPV